MQVIKPDTLSFLEDLNVNNNRDWFTQNRSRYDLARENFVEFVNSIIVNLSSIDSDLGHIEAKDCIFRIYRDVRFSHNKSPYKTNMGAFISKGGKKSSYAGYYFHLEPNASFISGGIYRAPSNILKTVREDIDFYSNDFLAIVENSTFLKTFPSLGTDKLKRVPTGFSAQSPVAEYLKFKSITPMQALSNEQVLDGNLLGTIDKAYKLMQPLIAFINRAIDAE